MLMNLIVCWQYGNINIVVKLSFILKISRMPNALKIGEVRACSKYDLKALD